MNCQDAQLFVSALYDGEVVPQDAAAHIASCAPCRDLLNKYAQIGARLRLMAAAEGGTDPAPLGNLPPKRRRWSSGLTGRVLVPRFAIGVVLIAIAGLSIGLALVHGQGSGPWFQYEVTDVQSQGTGGNVLQTGEYGTGESSSPADPRITLYEVKVIDVRNDSAQVEVRARKFNTEPDGRGGKFIIEPDSRRATVKSREDIDRLLSSATPQRFDYKPGQKLSIQVDGGGTLVLTGKVYRIRPSFWAPGYIVNPAPNEIVLSNPAMVRGREFLGNIAGSASAAGGNSAIGACVPPVGSFVFALKPFPGAIQGVTEFGRARFTMDGQEYTLFSATPITGGEQPREIWIYRGPNCPSVALPGIMGSGSSPYNVLPILRK
ncbi:MAG TPA: hypothetical protein VFL79_11240 [Terriglobia bacterium]|nr:hypothetical protein [Terriglobia bacterium]